MAFDIYLIFDVGYLIMRFHYIVASISLSYDCQTPSKPFIVSELGNYATIGPKILLKRPKKIIYVFRVT